MARFPKPLPLPKEYQASRSQRLKEITLSIVFGVFFRLLIIGAEIVGFFLFGSFALLADALASLADILSSLLLLIGIRVANRDPDKDHPFGHGRFEPLAGLQLALLLVAGGAVLAYNQLFSIGVPDKTVISGIAWVIPVSAVILLEIAYRLISSYADKNGSPALKADAAHFRIDAVNSLFAAFALLLGAFFPAMSGTFDHLGALFIALLMIVMGFKAAKSNFGQLTDQRPSDSYFAITKRAAFNVPGVLGVEKINIQLSGPDAHIDIDIEVDAKMQVDEAHLISQKVRREIQLVWPKVRDVVVHVEPYYPSDH